MISNPVHDEVYSIKFVSDLRQVGGFLHQQNWPPWYNWNIVERDIQHHKTKPSIYRWPNTENLNKMSSKWPPCSHIDFSRKYIVCISPSLNTTSLQIISSWSQTIYKLQVDHTKTSIWLPFNHLELLMHQHFIFDLFNNKIVRHHPFILHYLTTKDQLLISISYN